MGFDNSLRLDNFRNNFKIEVINLKGDDIEFDMIGIDPALANAFRRILIAEVGNLAEWIETIIIDYFSETSLSSWCLLPCHYFWCCYVCPIYKNAWDFAQAASS